MLRAVATTTHGPTNPSSIRLLQAERQRRRNAATRTANLDLPAAARLHGIASATWRAPAGRAAQSAFGAPAKVGIAQRDSCSACVVRHRVVQLGRIHGELTNCKRRVHTKTHFSHDSHTLALGTA